MILRLKSARCSLSGSMGLLTHWHQSLRQDTGQTRKPLVMYLPLQHQATAPIHALHNKLANCSTLLSLLSLMIQTWSTSDLAARQFPHS